VESSPRASPNALRMRDEILRLFGERLRQIRTERNLSQERLAELAGLDRNYIGQIERAERNVALVNIIRIAKALEIEPQTLFASFTRAKLATLR
jgi:transcriptional regulator with XRE-family HTH domain